MKALVRLLASALLVCSGVAISDTDYNHFPAVEAPDLNTALCNIHSYNKKLSDITSKEELTAADMVKVHELTYTLENALARLQLELVTIATDLEEVHLASEKLDVAKLTKHGEQYLEQSDLFVTHKSC